MNLAVIISLVLCASFNGWVCSNVMRRHINIMLLQKPGTFICMFFRCPSSFTLHIDTMHNIYNWDLFIMSDPWLVDSTDVWSYQLLHNHITSKMTELLLVSFFAVWCEDNNVKQISFYHNWEKPIVFCHHQNKVQVGIVRYIRTIMIIFFLLLSNILSWFFMHLWALLRCSVGPTFLYFIKPPFLRHGFMSVWYLGGLRFFFQFSSICCHNWLM